MELRKYSTISAVLLLSSVLSGCSFIPWMQEPEKQVITDYKYVKQEIPLQKHPAGVEPRSIQWYVVTKDNMDSFVETFTKENDQLVFYAVSVTDYERMSLNLADIIRYLEQQKQIIVYYEEAIQRPVEEQKPQQ